MGRSAAPRPFLPRLRCAVRKRGSRAADPVVAAAVLAVGAMAGPVEAQAPIPQGAEFRVNTYTTAYQFYAAVASDDDGDFVVTWSNFSWPVSRGIRAQRFSSSGEMIGSEIEVNDTATTNAGILPSVAMSSGGDFVIGWSGLDEGSNFSSVYARRYDSMGNPGGGPFRVDNTVERDQYLGEVGMDSEGDFSIAWEGFSESLYGSRNIFMEIYESNGDIALEDYIVNTYTTGTQNASRIAVGENGNFVVVWESLNQNGVYAQRFGPSGEPQGEEFRVNGSTTSGYRLGDVDMGASGDFVVTWASVDVNGYEVYARRYDPAGQPRGGAFRVNAATSGTQRSPSVAVDVEGGFVVAWTTMSDGGDYDVYARQYRATGEALSPEFRVNTRTTGTQSGGAVAIDHEGDFVVVWSDYDETSSAYDVYARRYRSGTVSTEPGASGGWELAPAANPMRGRGPVRYTVPTAGRVRLAVYDVLGREVAVLADGAVAAGSHEAPWDTAALAPGVYVVRLEAGGHALVHRVTVAR